MNCQKHNEEKILIGKRYKCRSCNKEYQEKWYKNNSRKHKDRVNEARKENKEKLRNHIFEYLSKNCCNTCGEKDILVLEFDHLSDKSFNISEAIASSFSLTRLEKEIKKCQVLCANCHRRKTAIEQNHYRFLKTQKAND
jgi:hypothetical protein